MKGKGVVCALAAMALCASTAMADITSIQHNLQGAGADTSFDAGTGVLTISSNVNNTLTVNENGVPVAGAITNAAVTLTTNLSGFSAGVATFTGGSILLQFEQDSIGYAIGGPISGMEFAFTQLTGTVGQIDGEGLFDANIVNLPASGVWPDSGGLSSIDSLTLTFDTGSPWDWAQGFANGETVYSLFPNDSAVPEPATLALLLGGGMVMAWRRK